MKLSDYTKQNRNWLCKGIKSKVCAGKLGCRYISMAKIPCGITETYIHHCTQSTRGDSVLLHAFIL